MSVSRLAVDKLDCRMCGAPFAKRVWRVVDLQERADLRQLLAGGTWRTVACPACGATQERSSAMLVLHLSSTAPVVLGVPDDALALDDPVAPESALLEATVTALGERRRDVPGPVLAVPFDVLAVAAGRALDDDVAGRARLNDLNGETAELARRYGVFLKMIRDSTPERRLNLAFDRLATVTSVEELRAAFVEVPELGERRVHDALAAEIEQAGTDADRLVAKARFHMVRIAASGRFEEAWATYARAAQTLVETHLFPRATDLMDKLRTAGAHDPARAAEVGEELIAFLGDYGAPGFRVEAFLRTASALYAVEGPGVEDRLERVIGLCVDAVQVLDANPDDPDVAALEDERPRLLLNMGAAYSRRLRGDPAANAERACALQREVLRLVTIDSNPSVWAAASTNLAMSLVERARERPNGDPQRAADVAEAIERLDDALRWRSFERDPQDWAFTQSGLGLAFAQREGGDRRSNLVRAVRHHEEAARGFEASGANEPRAQALHNAASERIVLATLDETPADERAKLLSEASADCRTSLNLRPFEAAPAEAGRTAHQLAQALELQGDAPGAMRAYRRALDGLAPETAPQACRDTARRLAELSTSAGDWNAAADAWEIATDAAAAALESRTATRERFHELAQQVNLFRWAAYGLLRAGRSRKAVEVLEQGRARELAVWLDRHVVPADLREADPGLCQRYVDLRTEIEAYERAQRDGLAYDLATAAGARDALRRTVDEIRAIPGLERFLRARRYDEIADGVGTDEALAYLLTAPEGSAVIIVLRGRGPDVIDLATLSSTQAVRALVRQEQANGRLSGYLIAQAQAADELDGAIDELARFFGPSMLKPLSERLEHASVVSVCLVATGLLGLVPLHALSWEEAGSNVCLADRWDVILAPSALAREVCRRRAAERPPAVRLLSVGNPLPTRAGPLPCAAFEAAMVARTLPASEARVLTGANASKEAVVGELPGKTHVHFACHGAAALSASAFDSGLFFAYDEGLTAAELLDLQGFAPRLVVASACQTGINPGYETADEALALSTVLLGAGAAGVVASLWEVDDLATALLMSRFYEELAAGAAPERALRVAALWLRDLSAEGATTYVSTRPALRHFTSSRVTKAGATTRGTPGDGHDRPFSAPSLWAAFVFSGA